MFYNKKSVFFTKKRSFFIFIYIFDPYFEHY